MCIGLGFCTSLFFMLTIKEIPLTEEAKRLDEEYKKLLTGDQASMAEEQ